MSRVCADTQVYNGDPDIAPIIIPAAEASWRRLLDALAHKRSGQPWTQGVRQLVKVAGVTDSAGRDPGTACRPIDPMEIWLSPSS
jgi:hypothetical protein